MKQHYSEADLLETYYMQPGESMPVMMHLAACSECAARYERLERKLRSLAACEHDKPETFWARQRMSVMRRLEKQPSAFSHLSRIAAAAVLTVVIGGTFVSNRVFESSSDQVIKTEETTLESSSTDSPWASEQLDDYQSMVAWESWVEAEKTQKTGDQAL